MKGVSSAVSSFPLARTANTGNHRDHHNRTPLVWHHLRRLEECGEYPIVDCTFGSCPMFAKDIPMEIVQTGGDHQAERLF